MNEATKVRQYILELLSARPLQGASDRWLEREVALSGYDKGLVRGELDTLESQKMVERKLDDIGISSWMITQKGCKYVNQSE